MRLRHTTLLTLLMFSFIFSSCGDLFTNKKSNSSLEFASTELDTEAFGRILEENIGPQIDALQDAMETYIKVAKSDKPGHLSRKGIQSFIKKDPNISVDTINIIDSVFDLSFLIFGGDKDYIAKKNVKKLTTFLKSFNSLIIPVYQRFKSDNLVGHELHIKESRVVEDLIDQIAAKLSLLVNTDRGIGQVDEIETDVFLNNFFGKKPENLAKIKSLMFLKKVFLGGDVYKLTHLEFLDALTNQSDEQTSKIASLAKAVFDFAKADRFNFDGNQQLMLGLYSRDIDIFIQNIFFEGDGNEKSFDIDDILGAIETMAPDLSDSIFGKGSGISLFDYRKEILVIKEPFFGAGPHDDPDSISEDFSSLQLIKFLENIKFIAQKGLWFYRIYDQNIDLMNSPDIITKDIEFTDNQVDAKDFSRIARKYKFLKGNGKSAFFDYKYHRNPDAFFEIAALEFGVSRIMSVYGEEKKAARGGYHMQYDDALGVINKVRRFLRDLGIVNIGREGGEETSSTADNLVLMSTLFQHQSNGCNKNGVCMEVPELTEFLVGLITAIGVKDFFVTEVKKLCPSVDPEIDHNGDGVVNQVDRDLMRISVSCFRKNFITVMEQVNPDDGRSLADYMPRIYDYLIDLTSDATDLNDFNTSKKFTKFISVTEDFTRVCKTDGVTSDLLPMKGADAFAVFAGLLNLESTFLRFDRDQNGLMDGKKGNDEVLYAYNNVYKGAIKGLASQMTDSKVLQKIIKKLSKPIFRYLVKYGTPPQTGNGRLWKFIRFLVRFNKKADATRLSIANILKTLGESSAGNPFKCLECMSTPYNSCVPEGPNGEPLPWE